MNAVSGIIITGLFLLATVITTTTVEMEQEVEDFCASCISFVTAVAPSVGTKDVEQVALAQCHICFIWMNSTYCDEMVGAYLPALEQNVEDGVSAQRICEQFKFCIDKEEEEEEEDIEITDLPRGKYTVVM